MSDVNKEGAQRLFNKVRDHLLKQGKRSMSANGVDCAYFGSDGQSCAIGCLIPYHLYSRDMEGAGVSEMLRHNPFFYSYLVDTYGLHIDLMASLQSIHDIAIPQEWEVELKSIARCYGLDFAAKSETEENDNV